MHALKTHPNPIFLTVTCYINSRDNTAILCVSNPMPTHHTPALPYRNPVPANRNPIAFP